MPSYESSAFRPYVPRLRRDVVRKVGETFELVLVDLLDRAVVHRRQDGFFSREVLVKVVHVPFGFLTTQHANVG